MKNRSFWIEQIGRAWERRSIIWLSGVRRVGKTFLSQSLRDAEYFDCELPRVRMMLEDIEGFLRSQSQEVSRTVSGRGLAGCGSRCGKVLYPQLQGNGCDLCGPCRLDRRTSLIFL